MKKQKEAVVEQVLTHVPTFVRGKDNAILILTATQLESIKSNITAGICQGVIEYGKNRTDLAEVRTYARSMVMNHLKKAKELNGGHTYKTTTSNGAMQTTRVKAIPTAPKGVNPDILTDELKEYVKTLV